MWGQLFYHISSHVHSSLESRGEGTRQGNPQRNTSAGWQVELIVHEDVVGKQLIVSAGQQSLDEL